jgi:hypothetical protein
VLTQQSVEQAIAEERARAAKINAASEAGGNLPNASGAAIPAFALPRWQKAKTNFFNRRQRSQRRLCLLSFLLCT